MSAPEPGPVLALDSATRTASVALGVGGRTVREGVAESAAGASSSLLPAVEAVVRGAGYGPEDIRAVVVGAGPGSFTGLRIAAATAKGIVRARGVPLLAYSSLLAEAATRRGAAGTVCALFDARNREVFAGCWRFGGAAPEAVLAPVVLRLEAVLERLSGREVLFTGEAAALYAGEIGGAGDPGWRVAEGTAGETPAAALLWLADACAEAGRVADASGWEPEYLRASGAERMAAARAG